MRFCDVGFMGSTVVQTPHLDGLAAQAVVFDHVFSSSPICGPARGTLLTGQYPVTHGAYANDVALPSDGPALGEAFARMGYRTGLIGKWHLAWPPREPGFVPPGPERKGFQFWAAHECDHDYRGGHYFMDTPEPIPFRRYAPKEETDIAIDFMRSTTDQPFLLMLNFGIPHMPIPNHQQTEEEYRALYAAADIPLRPNVPEHARDRATAYLRHYYGMITVLDDQVGRLLAALDALGIADDTIVCFCADHGDMLGSHGLIGLQLPWDECVRVPFVVRWPARVPRARRVSTFVNLADLLPTLLSLCGTAPARHPAGIQGHDHAGVILGADDAGPDTVFLSDTFPCHQRYGHEPWRAVRTRRWLYARYPDRTWLLYDMLDDPYQLRNLRDSAEHQSARGELEGVLNAWLTRLDDSFPDRERLEQDLRKHDPRKLDSVRMAWGQPRSHPPYLMPPIPAQVAEAVSFS